MKAITTSIYGNPEDVLQVSEVEKPVPKENEILIKVNCTTINDYDWSLTTGKPSIYRMLFGLTKPKQRIPGMELSGTIETVGSKVITLKPGDDVFGDISGYGFGSFAEYLCIDEHAVIKKPTSMSFEDAASLPHASLLALQGLEYKAKIADGMSILINGAGGGVGTLGIQIAKRCDCEVTGVDSLDKHAMMKSLGYDHVIDYRKTDFTRTGKQYDLILDCKTNRSVFAYKRALKRRGTYLTVGGTPSTLMGILVLGKIVVFNSRKKFKILALKPNRGLDVIEQLYESGNLKTAIDGPYTMNEIPRLVKRFGEGKHKGKIVVRMS